MSSSIMLLLEQSTCFFLVHSPSSDFPLYKVGFFYAQSDVFTSHEYSVNSCIHWQDMVVVFICKILTTFTFIANLPVLPLFRLYGAIRRGICLQNDLNNCQPK